MSAAMANSSPPSANPAAARSILPARAPPIPSAPAIRAGCDFRSDCADLPYVLRFYYAWKRGLPFSYVSDVSPRGRTRDIRYSPKGNRVERGAMC